MFYYFKIVRFKKLAQYSSFLLLVALIIFLFLSYSSQLKAKEYKITEELAEYQIEIRIIKKDLLAREGVRTAFGKGNFSSPESIVFWSKEDLGLGKPKRCAPISIATTLSGFGKKITPSQIIAGLEDEGKDYTYFTSYKNYLKKLGFESLVKNDGTLEILKNYIDKGIPLMPAFKQIEDYHTEPIIAYNERRNIFIGLEPNYIIQNPKVSFWEDYLRDFDFGDFLKRWTINYKENAYLWYLVIYPESL